MRPALAATMNAESRFKALGVLSEMGYLRAIDPEDSRPPSQQIADRIRAAILEGELRAGAKLPSQPDLATRYGVARETIKAALRLLQRDHLISSQQGKGSYVREPAERTVSLRPQNELEALEDRIEALADMTRQTLAIVTALAEHAGLDVAQIVASDKEWG